MREKNLIEKIKTEVASNRVKSQFRSNDFYFLKNSRGFLSKHNIGNGVYNEYFKRVGRGLYEIL